MKMSEMNDETKSSNGVSGREFIAGTVGGVVGAERGHAKMGSYMVDGRISGLAAAAETPTTS